MKKRLNVIRPTLRHKKLYIKLSFSKNISYDVFQIFLKNYINTHGFLSSIECNLTLMQTLPNNILIFRLNKLYQNDFLSSLFFLKEQLGLVVVLKQASTLKSLL